MQKISFENIEQEYLSENDLFCSKIKKLTLSERRLLILYAELKSYQKVAVLLNTSRWTVMRMVRRIKNKIT